MNLLTDPSFWSDSNEESSYDQVFEIQENTDNTDSKTSLSSSDSQIETCTYNKIINAISSDQEIEDPQIKKRIFWKF